jgi:FkbM family methyltransferase
MSNEVQDDLIFDLGLHKGYDAEFYLAKGFRVVGLEAVPSLCAQAQEFLAHFGDRLSIVQKALSDSPGDTVDFFTVPGKDDWGSLFQGIAEKGVETSVRIEVETIDLSTIFDTYGVPHYIKCDLEGGDQIFLRQLVAEKRRPRYVSVEMSDGTEGAQLREAGYDEGQIVNQWMNPFKIAPNPPLEGSFVERHFTGEMSGLFGQELNPQRWLPLADIDRLYGMWKALRDEDQELAPGWVDVHARRAEDRPPG